MLSVNYAVIPYSFIFARRGKSALYRYNYKFMKNGHAHLCAVGHYMIAWWLSLS